MNTYWHFSQKPLTGYSQRVICSRRFDMEQRGVAESFGEDYLRRERVAQPPGPA